MTETGLARQYELKTAPAAGPVNVDEETGIVEAVVSVTGIVDHGNDVIEPGAYKQTLSERNPKVCWAHDWKNPVGKVLEAVELMPGDDRLPAIFHKVGAGALYVRTQFNLKTQSGRDAFENVKFWGDEGEWSIGYDCSPARGGSSYKGKDGARHIDKLALFEVSPVLHGMAPLTATLSTKGLTMVDLETMSEIDYPEEKKRPIRDADSDGLVYDGTVRERPAPPRMRNLRHIPTNVGRYDAPSDALTMARGFDVDVARSDTSPELPRAGSRENPRNWSSATLDQTIIALRDSTRHNRSPEDGRRLRTLRELRAARGGLPSNPEITDIAATVRETANNWTPDEIATMAETQTTLAEATPQDYRRAYVARTLADLVEETDGDPTDLHDRLDMLPPQPDDTIDVGDRMIPTPDNPPTMFDERRRLVAQHRTGASERAAAREAARLRGRSRVARYGKSLKEDLMETEIVGEEIDGVEGVDWEWVECDANGNEISEKSGEFDTVRETRGDRRRRARSLARRERNDRDGDNDGRVGDGTPQERPAAGGIRKPGRSEINWYLQGGGDPAWRAAIEAGARQHGVEMVKKKGKKKKRKKGKWDDPDGPSGPGTRVKSLTDWEESDMEDLVDVSAEDLASAATDALDLMLATEFSDEDVAVVGWVEDTYDDHVAVGVGHYDEAGKPAVEFWDLPVSWYDGDNGIFAELGDPVLMDVVGVAPEPGKSMCMSAAEIIRSGIASKAMLQARRRMEMVVDEAEEKGLIDAEGRYDPTDTESKDGAYCDRPSMAARVIKKRSKRKPKEKAEEIETLDAYNGAVTKTALDLLTEVQVFVTSTEPSPEGIVEMQKSLAAIIDSTKTAEPEPEVKDDGAVLMDPDMLTYAIERGIDPFGDEEAALEPACPDTA